MYVCGVCGRCSEPRQPRLLHVIYRAVTFQRWFKGDLVTRTRKEIEKEIPVCRGCYAGLQIMTLDELLSRLFPFPEEEMQLPIAPLPRRVALGRSG